MSTTIYEVDHGSKIHCKDCDYSTDSAFEFSEHVRICPVKPILMPAAEIERRQIDSKILKGETTDINVEDVT